MDAKTLTDLLHAKADQKLRETLNKTFKDLSNVVDFTVTDTIIELKDGDKSIRIYVRTVLDAIRQRAKEVLTEHYRTKEVTDFVNDVSAFREKLESLE